MNILLIDSSTPILYVSLIKNDILVYEKYLAGKNDHAKNIVFCIEESLKKGNLEVEQLDRVIIGYGPGSYTGVRMAVTVGKMLSVFKKVPLYTISTLKLMASSGRGICKVSIDARRQNAFACIINMETSEILLEEALYSYEELDKYPVDCEIKEDSFIVNPFYCNEHCCKVEEPHLLIPNYLRETEAERNLQ